MTRTRLSVFRLYACGCVLGVLAGCGGDAGLDRRGLAATLAETVAAERDHVDAAQLADWIIKDRRDFVLVDIRDRADFEAGHIEGARHLPLAGLLSDAALDELPRGRRVVVYSNGTAHAAQAAILLRLVERDAYALLGGYNYWQGFLTDPDTAGVAGMAPAERAAHQAVACYFEGDYVAAAGLVPRTPGGVAASPAEAGSRAADPLGLGLGLGLGSETVRDAVTSPPAAPAPAADPLGLGLGLGLGSDEVRSQPPPAAAPPKQRKLLIKAEC